jgi:hypothetical protein
MAGCLISWELRVELTAVAEPWSLEMVVAILKFLKAFGLYRFLRSETAPHLSLQIAIGWCIVTAISHLHCLAHDCELTIGPLQLEAFLCGVINKGVFNVGRQCHLPLSYTSDRRRLPSEFLCCVKSIKV